MKKIVITFIFGLFAAQLSAQNKNAVDTAEVKALQVKVDQSKSANTKDVLTSFLQTGIDNLLGDQRAFKLSLSFLAIDSLLNGKNAKSKISRKSFFRNSSLNFNLTGDSVNNIVKGSLGFTLELLNWKDIRLKKWSSKTTQKVTDATKSYSLIRDAVIEKLIDDIEKNSRLANDKKVKMVDTAERGADASFNLAFNKHDFKNLNPNIKAVLRDSIFINNFLKSDTSGSLAYAVKQMNAGIDLPYKVFQTVVQEFSRKPLWIMKPTVAYDRVYKQGEYVVESTFTKGFGSLDRTPWEVEIKGRLLIGADSTITTGNYKNKPLTVSLGINKVLLQNENKESRAELKFFTQYDYKLGSHVGRKDEFSLNSTLRFNVHKAIWLPLTIRYDPNNGNVFGFFSVTANIGN